MANHWASENLQVIRTLMERAALYRRAQAPLMLTTGALGLGGGMTGLLAPVSNPRSFSLYWMVISVVALLASLLLVRRQAWQAGEPFWSPPMRRVTQALGPAFFTGLIAGCVWATYGNRIPVPTAGLAGIWMMCYGCGLHAAGFFMTRGIRLFGWILLVCGGVVLLALPLGDLLASAAAAHLLMAGVFGLLHLAYGIYLYFTEKTRKPL
jgi:hypothetical protein